MKGLYCCLCPLTFLIEVSQGQEVRGTPLPLSWRHRAPVCNTQCIPLYSVHSLQKSLFCLYYVTPNLHYLCPPQYLPLPTSHTHQHKQAGSGCNTGSSARARSSSGLRCLQWAPPSCVSPAHRPAQPEVAWWCTLSLPHCWPEMVFSFRSETDSSRC